MSRRRDPERIHEARRAAVVSRLTGEGFSEERADELVAEWEAEAGRRGLEQGADYWHQGTAWIYDRRLGRPPA